MKNPQQDQRRSMREPAVNKTTLSIALALMLTSFSFAQQTNKPLTNDDVSAMVKSSLPEEVILNAIQANETNFDTPPMR